MGTTTQDIKQAARGLLRRPGFTLVAALSPAAVPPGEGGAWVLRCSTAVANRSLRRA